MKIAKYVALFAIVSVAVALVAAQVDSRRSLITQPINESKVVVLRGNTHPMARQQFDRGAAPASLPVERVMLVLKSTPEQGQALDALIAEQQDRTSANYHKWLTPEEFGQRFGASDADIQKVTAWLTSHGFRIDSVAKGHNVIQFSGNAAQVQSAFHAALHKYQISGKQYWANANDPAIPAALSPAVAGIASLNNFPRPAAHHFVGNFTREASGKLKPKPAANPAFTFAAGCNGPGTNCYGVAPYDFATIYNILPLWTASPKIDGTGQTIAIVSDSDVNPADLTNFRSLFGLPALGANQFNRIYTPGSSSTTPGIQGNEGEADVDIEWSGAVAPGATIDLVISADTAASFGGDISAQYIIDNNVAPIMGYSYGACEFFLGTTGNQLYGGSPVKDVSGEWAQAATEGIAVVVSTGDTGSTDCEMPTGNPPVDEPAVFGLAVSGIASTPYNVAVGGTDFDDGPTSSAQNFWNSTNAATTQQSVNGYIPEVPYNSSCVNVPLDLLYDTSASQDSEANCNKYAGAGSNLGFLVAPFGGGGGVSGCTTSNFDPSGNGGNGSGAFSSCSGGYAKPTWQTGTGVPADGKRDVPDISGFAGDGTFQNFYVYCQQDLDFNGGACSLSASVSGTSTPFPDIQGVGGTSVSAEAFAGMMALLNQKQGSAQGLPNKTLYALAAQPGAACQSSGTLTSACIFYQQTSGSIAMPCINQDNGFGVAPGCTIATSGDTVGVTAAGGSPAYSASSSGGFNLATGLGSINVFNLVSEWTLGGPSGTCTSNCPDFTISANPTALKVTAGQSGTTTLTIVPVNGFSDTVTFGSTACAGLPTGATCAFSTSSVSANGTTTLTIQTAAPASVPPAARLRGFDRWRAPLILVLGCALASFFLFALRAKNRRWGLAIASAAFLVFLGIAGCGGSGGGSNNQQQVATPTFSPAPGSYSSTQSVTISDATTGASIFYTTNGTTPTTSSTKYTGAISVSSTETIEAIATASGLSNSAVATGTYTIQANAVPVTVTITGTDTTTNVSRSTTVMLTVQ